MPKLMFMGYMQPPMKKRDFSVFLEGRCGLPKMEAASVIKTVLSDRHSATIEVESLKKAYAIANAGGKLGVKCGVVR